LREDPTLPHEPLPVRGHDDIADLTRGFNTFLEGLQERERAEQALRQAETERQARLAAEAANEAKSHFLARMSHDLRTPLNAMLGYAQLLQRDKSLSERQFAALKTIRSSGDHLLTLINDILDLSKIEAGKMDLFLETFEVAPVVQDVASTVYPLAEQRANIIEQRIGPGVGSVHADQTKVRQGLLNLLSNAAKFSEPDTPIEVRCGTSPEGEIVVTVADHGIGMTPREVAQATRPFYQADSRLARKYEGSGLGLSIVSGLMGCHLGRLAIESAPGAGSQISLVFPASAACQTDLAAVA
jgi:signal transduction histidine kinase